MFDKITKVGMAEPNAYRARLRFELEKMRNFITPERYQKFRYLLGVYEDWENLRLIELDLFERQKKNRPATNGAA